MEASLQDALRDAATDDLIEAVAVRDGVGGEFDLGLVERGVVAGERCGKDELDNGDTVCATLGPPAGDAAGDGSELSELVGGLVQNHEDCHPLRTGAASPHDLLGVDRADTAVNSDVEGDVDRDLVELQLEKAEFGHGVGHRRREAGEVLRLVPSDRAATVEGDAEQVPQHVRLQVQYLFQRPDHSERIGALWHPGTGTPLAQGRQAHADPMRREPPTDLAQAQISSRDGCAQLFGEYRDSLLGAALTRIR